MQRKDTKLDLTGQEIYVGLDTGKISNFDQTQVPRHSSIHLFD